MRKRLFIIIISLFITSLFLSCKKNNDNSLPECDVNGVWIGEWESNLQINGTFCANVTQDLTNYSGYICIRIEEPGKKNYNKNFEGTVKRKNVRTVMSISGVEIAAEGDITDDTIVSGNFNVPDLSMHGTFNGKKIPTTEAKLTEVYSSPQGKEEHISDFIFIDNSLWIFMYSHEEYEGKPKIKVFKYDINGNFIETIYYPSVLSGDISSDGQYIWNLSNGTSISKHDINGNKVDSLELTGSMDSHKLACSSSHLFLFRESIIYKTDHSLNIKDSINPRYNYPTAYAAYKNYQLYSSKNVLYKMNTDGEIIHAYVLPKDKFIYDIETNGNKVWCFVNWYGENSDGLISPDLSYYTIYDIDLN